MVEGKVDRVERKREAEWVIVFGSCSHVERVIDPSNVIRIGDYLIWINCIFKRRQRGL